MCAPVELGRRSWSRSNYDADPPSSGRRCSKRHDHAGPLPLRNCYHRRSQPSDAAEAKREFSWPSRRTKATPRPDRTGVLQQAGSWSRPRAFSPGAAASTLLARSEVERSLGAALSGLKPGSIRRCASCARQRRQVPEDAAAQGLLGQALLQSAQRRASRRADRRVRKQPGSVLEPPPGPTSGSPGIAGGSGRCSCRWGRCRTRRKGNRAADAQRGSAGLVTALLTLGKLRLSCKVTAPAPMSRRCALCQRTRRTRNQRPIVNIP